MGRGEFSYAFMPTDGKARVACVESGRAVPGVLGRRLLPGPIPFAVRRNPRPPSPVKLYRFGPTTTSSGATHAADAETGVDDDSESAAAAAAAGGAATAATAATAAAGGDGTADVPDDDAEALWVEVMANRRLVGATTVCLAYGTRADVGAVPWNEYAVTQLALPNFGASSRGSHDAAAASAAAAAATEPSASAAAGSDDDDDDDDGGLAEARAEAKLQAALLDRAKRVAATGLERVCRAGSYGKAQEDPGGEPEDAILDHDVDAFPCPLSDFAAGHTPPSRSIPWAARFQLLKIAHGRSVCWHGYHIAVKSDGVIITHSTGRTTKAARVS